MIKDHRKSRFYLARAWRVALTLALVLGLANSALAHKVNVFAYAEGGQIKGEGYFPGGDKAQDSLVELWDAQGKVVASTRTDRRGEFTLSPLPGASPPLKVVVKASMGHQGDYTLGARVSQAPEPATAARTPRQTMGGTVTAPPDPGEGDLETRLARLLDNRLEPLTTQIAKMNAERGVSVHDVVAGLGYILGLLGLAAYLKNRR
jgi:nickel transport protein